MRLRLLAFARLRELLGWSEREIDVAADARAEDVWSGLVAECAALAPLRDSTRVAVNGSVAARWDGALKPDDEIALLPPSSGG